MTTRTIAFVGRGLSKNGGGSKREGACDNKRHQELAHGVFSLRRLFFQPVVDSPTARRSKSGTNSPSRTRAATTDASAQHPAGPRPAWCRCFVMAVLILHP